MLSLTSSLMLLATLTSALNITILQPNVPFTPSPLPLPGARANCDTIVFHFATLGRTTIWNLVQKVHFQGPTYEPGGMVKLGTDRFFVSAGEYKAPTVKYSSNSTVIVNGTDRSAGAGFAHLMVFDENGARIADATLTAQGATEYHNGGIDYDGEFVWATIAQYRPNTTATLTKIDPVTLQPTPLVYIADHEGAAVHDVYNGNILTLNWGSRNASLWKWGRQAQETVVYPAFAKLISVTRNPSYYTDYQDCKFLGRPLAYASRAVMICSGVTSIYGTQIGGVALVDMLTMIPLAEVPITMVSDLGVLVTENPFDVDVVDGRLRFYFLPDQMNSTLYVYEALPGSLFEYGGSMMGEQQVGFEGWGHGGWPW